MGIKEEEKEQESESLSERKEEATSPAHFNSKYHENFKNDDMRRWYESMAKRSPQRASVYFRAVSRFCKSLNTTPWDYARLPRRKMEDKVMDYVSRMEQQTNPRSGEPYSTNYIEKYTDAIKSWAEWMNRKFQRKIVVGETSFVPIGMRERVPTQKEMSSVLYADSTPLRTRVIISHMGHGGMRFMSFGDFRGTDGLRIKDFPALKIVTDPATGKQIEVKFETLPSEIIVRKNLSKIRKEYRTQESSEAGEVLVQWLNSRIKSGEVLTKESGIVVTTSEDSRRLKVPHERLGVVDASPFLCSAKVSALVREAMRDVGLPWRPYIWRSYFDTVLTTA